MYFKYLFHSDQLSNASCQASYLELYVNTLGCILTCTLYLSKSNGLYFTLQLKKSNIYFILYALGGKLSLDFRTFSSLFHHHFVHWQPLRVIRTFHNHLHVVIFFSPHPVDTFTFLTRLFSVSTSIVLHFFSVLCFSACSTVFSSTYNPFLRRTLFMYFRAWFSESAFSPKWVYSSSVVGTQFGSISTTCKTSKLVNNVKKMKKTHDYVIRHRNKEVMVFLGLTCKP